MARRETGLTWSWMRRLPVRTRLALWHMLAVLVVLVGFAVATERHLRRTYAERVDASLAETAQLVTQLLEDEASEEHASFAVAVADGVREVRYRDRRVLIVGDEGGVLATSDTTALGSFRAGRDAVSSQPAIARLLASARTTGREYALLGADDAEVRVLAVRMAYGAIPITLVIARGMHEGDDDNQEFMQWLYTMIPFALALAGGFGYLLVRQSLAPALEMGRQAERISATRLETRLELVNAHDEIGQLGEVLNQLLGRLQSSFVQQQRFMADASHELRTPIAVVRSAADVALLSDASTVTELREALAIVRGEGRRMTRIVEDLFLLARADSDEQPVHRDVVYLEELVTDVAKAGRILGAARGITVTANVADEAPFVGDATLLTRLLMNLIENAIKFSPKHSTVRMTLSRDDDPAGVAEGGTAQPVYRIVVADEGPGVDAALRDTIFDRFIRGDRSRGRTAPSETGGAGLGLSIARWIAAAHGCTVRFDPSATRGAVFVIELPVPRVAPH